MLSLSVLSNHLPCGLNLDVVSPFLEVLRLVTSRGDYDTLREIDNGIEIDE